MSTCFGHGEGEGDRLCILIDLPKLSLMHGLAFLDDDGFAVQKYAYETFHKGFTNELLAELKYRQNDFFAFKTTGGSNLDPDDEVTDAGGADLSLERDVYPHYDLILAITDYSLTAPLTAMAKKYGFRGATLHGVNPIILESGLSVDYREVSVQAELFRSALTSADAFELDFDTLGETSTLRIECGGQEAQKSHGLCPRGKPDVANLPDEKPNPEPGKWRERGKSGRRAPKSARPYESNPRLRCHNSQWQHCTGELVPGR